VRKPTHDAPEEQQTTDESSDLDGAAHSDRLGTLGEEEQPSDHGGAVGPIARNLARDIAT
jgi:hypothetical protein